MNPRLFIKQFDKDNKDKTDYNSLSSQNISILEVGANAKAFAPFLEFLNIKTLIITDIDTTEQIKSNKKNTYNACEVDKGKYTSNATLRYFFKSPEKFKDEKWSKWFNELIACSLPNIHKNIKVTYQSKENAYHARSFEDAFINQNLNKIKSKSKEGKLRGLKCQAELESNLDIYDLTSNIIDKKSDFSASLLFLALSDDTQWETPLYIKEGLEWIAQK